MADARAELIMAAVRALITGLVTTGANVQRGQIYNHESEKLPALALSMGPDIPDAEFQFDKILWSLTLSIESTIKLTDSYLENTSDLETALNNIRNEVYAAVMADHQLGLGFVNDTIPGPAGRPVIDGEGDYPTGSQVMDFIVSYKASRADISQ